MLILIWTSHTNHYKSISICVGEIERATQQRLSMNGGVSEHLRFSWIRRERRELMMKKRSQELLFIQDYKIQYIRRGFMYIKKAEKGNKDQIARYFYAWSWRNTLLCKDTLKAEQGEQRKRYRCAWFDVSIGTGLRNSAFLLIVAFCDDFLLLQKEVSLMRSNDYLYGDIRANI